MILSLIEAWRVVLNPVDIRGGQSAHDNKSHTRSCGQSVRDDIIDVIKPVL